MFYNLGSNGFETALYSLWRITIATFSMVNGMLDFRTYKCFHQHITLTGHGRRSKHTAQWTPSEL